MAEVSDPGGNVSRHWFDNSGDSDEPSPLNGRPLETWRYGPEANLYQVVQNTWQAQTFSIWPEPVNFISKVTQRRYLCHQTVLDYEPASADLGACVKSQTDYHYDQAFGELRLEKTYAADGSVYRSTVRDYFHNEEDWLFTLAAEALYEGEVTAADLAADHRPADRLVALTGYLYDDKSPAEPTLRLGNRGQLTTLRRWTGEMPQTFVDQTFAYDPVYGNHTHTTNYNSLGSPTTLASTEARGTESGYDAQGILPIWTTNDLGHRRSTSYDYRFQVPRFETNANDGQSEYRYDNFGRLKEVHLPTCQENTIAYWHYDPLGQVDQTSVPAILSDSNLGIH